ncbi:anti-repressor SinI family protein [Alkalihalobacterium chitinilyticum]|uniref:Anti-repressor SinI family protein n=1 Tax=Alkalihalobacterium chitinilyticum TaxID=2980103 RepID=A0ABT5VHR5_9BACI|nr:anti-repressor SinI family protein [Alkalihalobacterium chitinilyticum]MDE5413774.1 anti-repressor SinI family protein [Alkalihalobacterium chitinilyticum]
MDTKTCEVLDKEWTVLMEEAKKLGLTIEEIREFFTKITKT